MSPGGPGGEGSTLQAPSGGSLDERDVAVTCYSVWFGFVGRTLIRVNRKYGRKKGSVRIKISSILEDADHVMHLEMNSRSSDICFLRRRKKEMRLLSIVVNYASKTESQVKMII